MSAYSPQKLCPVCVDSKHSRSNPNSFSIHKISSCNTYATMAICLLIIPQEIRTMILLYLLRSPTGHIVLYASTSRQSTRNGTLKIRPYDPNKPKSYRNARTIGFAVLRTCRQLYAESRGMIWKKNIVTFQFSRPIFADDTERALARVFKYGH